MSLPHPASTIQRRLNNHFTLWLKDLEQVAAINDPTAFPFPPIMAQFPLSPLGWYYLVSELLLYMHQQWCKPKVSFRLVVSVTPWTRARQALLSSTASRSCVKFMSVASMTLSNHLILCRPLLLLPSHFPKIRVFSRKSSLLMRWPKYWSLSFRICPSSEHSGLIAFRIDRFVRGTYHQKGIREGKSIGKS